MSLAEDIGTALNQHCAENASDTPDFILAEYLTDALAAFGKASRCREDWYGHRHAPGGEVTPSPERTQEKDAEDGSYEPFIASEGWREETEIRLVPESAVAEAVAAERERIARHLDEESRFMREQHVHEGLHPALAGGDREANLLAFYAAELRGQNEGSPTTKEEES